jgi:hypothetical protein
LEATKASMGRILPCKNKEDGFSSFEIFLLILNLIVSKDKEPNFVCNVCPSENISLADFINIKLFAKIVIRLVE